MALSHRMNKKQNNMKTIFKTTLVIIFLGLFISCGDDSSQEENPQGEGNNDCLTYKDLTTYYPNGLRYVQFINDNEGWVVGKSAENNQVLLKTEDGGNSWEEINNNLNTRFSNVPAPQLKFINSTDGFSIDKYVNGVQYRTSYTTDKGATWTPYDNPAVAPLRFPLGIWTAIASNSTKTVIVNDVHMTMVIDNTSKNIIQSVAMDEDLEDNLRHIWGDEIHLSENNVITCVLYWSNITRIAQSADYGLTWTYRQDMDLDYIQTMSWPNDNVGYIKGVVGFDDAHIYKTIDGGLTWERKDCPDFTTMAFADANNGLADYAGDFYKTTDGANTWEKICTDGEGESAGYVSYPSVDNGWFIGDKNTQYQEHGLFNYKGE